MLKPLDVKTKFHEVDVSSVESIGVVLVADILATVFSSGFFSLSVCLLCHLLAC